MQRYLVFPLIIYAYDCLFFSLLLIVNKYRKNLLCVEQFRSPVSRKELFNEIAMVLCYFSSACRIVGARGDD